MTHRLASPESPPATARRHRIAVVGAGPVGTLTTIHLLGEARRRGRFVDILLVDLSPGVAGGPAFATTNPEHILNTVAQDMTGDPADPDGFSRWVRANRHPDAGPFDFVPRSWFADYLRSASTACDHPGSISRFLTMIGIGPSGAFAGLSGVGCPVDSVVPTPMAWADDEAAGRRSPTVEVSLRRPAQAKSISLPLTLMSIGASGAFAGLSGVGTPVAIA